jgi:hypothetical protein
VIPKTRIGIQKYSEEITEEEPRPAKKTKKADK